MNNNISFIGCGKMGEAILSGIILSGIYKEKNIYFFDPNSKRKNLIKRQYKINFVKNNNQLIKKSKVIVLAVKPQAIKKVLDEIKGSISKEHLIISIAAGIKIKTIEKVLGCKVVRVMPNTPCLIGRGISAICYSKNVSKKDKKNAQRIFKSLGEIVSIDEWNMNAVTALSGSGPAFFYRLTQAFIKAGREEDLKENISKKLVLETMAGTIEMIKQSNKTIDKLVEDVSSTGGTTVAGRKILESSNYKKIISKTIKAAKKRADELSGNHEL